MLKKIAEQKGKKKRREQSPFLFILKKSPHKFAEVPFRAIHEDGLRMD